MSTRSSTRSGPRLVLAAGSLLDHSATTLVRAAASAGFDGVGLRLSGEHAMTSDREADELRRMADDLRLMIHDAEVIRIDETWARADRLPPEPVHRLLDMAARLGAVGVLVVSDLPDPAATGEAVAALVEEASPLGLVVGLEYMAWTTPARPTDALTMAEVTGSRVIVDVLHHARVGAGVDEFLQLVDADRLAWVQLCDAATADVLDLADFDRDAVIREARHGRLPPGHGVLPLAELLAAVPTETVISVEVQSDDLRNLGPVERAHLLATTTRALAGQ